MRAISILEWILRVAGLGALVLGLLFWIFQWNVISIHMLFGLAVALTLLIIGFMAVFTSGIRILGVVDILYAFVLPIFGINQFLLLIGNLHWLIQVAHMLVGIGALALAGVTTVFYRRRKQSTSPQRAATAPGTGELGKN